MNLYEILDASSDCSLDVLRQNYHRLLLEYHPDPDKRNSNDLITKKSFEDIQNAYRILSNPELQLKYDQEQGRRHSYTLPHTNINSKDFDDEYICRCGTVLHIDKEIDIHIIECQNFPMKIQLKQ